MAALAAITVYCTIAAIAPPAPATIGVMVAARDLPAGMPVSARDLRVARLPPDVAPSSAVRAGQPVPPRRLAGPLARGEPLTHTRFAAPGLLSGQPDLRAAPVRLDDAAVVALLGVGDRVDILAATTRGPAARLVAAGVPVLAIPAPSGDGSAFADAPGGLIVVAADPDEAAALAQASAGSRLSITIRS